jgi:CheY-like chemotaxis protein
MNGPSIILYAEDEENDVFFLKSAFEETGSSHIITAVPDGQQAIDYLAGQGSFASRKHHPHPALVLLDIKMPKKTGLEVLEWIRRQPEFKLLPVLMLTSSARQEDMIRARELGADDFLLKPSNPLKLVDVVKLLHERWLITDAAAAIKSSTPKPGQAHDV